MTISRPATVTTLRLPAAISEVVATTWRAIASPKLVDRPRIGVEDLGTFAVRQRRLEGKARVIVVPVRVVGGEQQPIDPNPLDHGAQVRTVLGLLDGLRGKPETLAHVLRWWPLQVWHLVPEALPVLVHAPRDGGYPAKAALDKHELQARKALGHALDDQACELGGNGVGVRMVLFVVVGGPAACGWRVATIAADVDAERQVGCLRRGVDRPIATAPQRLIGARGNVDLDVPAGSRAALNFRHRRLGVVLADHDRGLEAGLWLAPAFNLPVVDGALQGNAKFQVLLREDQQVEHL